MARKVIGPTGSRRRRWLFLCTAAAAIAAAVLFIPSAFAVHATGIFQLDTDASQSLNTNSNAGQTAASEDWDNVCAAHLQNPNNDNQPGPFCHPLDKNSLPAPTVASKSSFTTDAFNVSDDVFKGGTDVGGIIGSDGIGGALWQWKTAGAPDKSDIEQAFAAQYTCKAGAPPTGNNCSNGAYQGDGTPANPPHTILFFGGTRLSDAGDTNLGLWFLHNNVTECGANATCTPGSAPVCPVTSGCGFTGGHTCGNVSLGHATTCNGVAIPNGTPGDIFVASAFTAKPTLQIYEYVGLHNAANCISSECDLQRVTFPVNPNTGDNTCTTLASDNDAGCALINNSLVSSPWFFTDKNIPNGGALNTFGFGSKGGELFEGGLDLTALGFGNECISTFMLNTRSSGSGIGSVDQDFALGSMGGCTSKLTTSAASNASGLSIGTGTVNSGTDSGTVSVDGVSTWSGTVDFYLCGPIASGVCTNGGVKLNGTTGNAGVAVSNTTPTVSSGSATLTSAGRYCWFAHFTSNTNNVPNADEDGSGDTPLTGTSDPNPECFNVTAVKASLSTSATCTSTPCVLGVDTLTDTATLGNTATEPGDNGGSYTDSVGCGTPPCPHTTTYTSINATKTGNLAGLAPADNSISWKLYGPANSSTCPAAGPTLLTTSRTVDGNGVYAKTGPPENQSPVSYKPALADGVGTYVFLASYPGDGPNTLAADSTTCSDSAEAVVLIGSASSSSLQGWLPNDRVTLTTTGGTSLDGTLTVTLYSGTFTVNSTTHVCTPDQTATAVPNQQYTFDTSPSGVPDASGTSYVTSNTSFFVGHNPSNGNSGGADGDYFWLIHYDDSNLTDPPNRCESSNVTHNDAPTGS